MSVNGEVQNDIDAAKTKEWLDSLTRVLEGEGPDRARFLLDKLRLKAQRNGVDVTTPVNTPYINTIPVERQPPFPGNREMERRIKSIVRWNALAMVVRANIKADDTLDAPFHFAI